MSKQDSKKSIANNLIQDVTERKRPIKTYVVRSGRMTEAQKRAIALYGHDYIIPFTGEPVDLPTIFPNERPVVMEIGFGMGQASWQIALSRPQFNYLGAEVHAPGVGRLLLELKAHGILNFKIFQHDALEILETMIPQESLAGFHIFYPDPWPKKRHHKRRLMQKDHLNLMISRLKPDGYLYFVTDIEEYGRSTLELLSATPSIKNVYDGFASGITWRPETKFEHKARLRAHETLPLGSDAAVQELKTAWELFFKKL